MKLVEAVVAPERLGDIKEALQRVAVVRLTVADVTALERAGPGADSPFEARPRVRLEIAVNENFLQPTVAAIREACGGPGDHDGGGDGGDGGGGRIFVHPLRDVIRVRTGERGPEAI